MTTSNGSFMETVNVPHRETHFSRTNKCFSLGWAHQQVMCFCCAHPVNFPERWMGTFVASVLSFSLQKLILELYIGTSIWLMPFCWKHYLKWPGTKMLCYSAPENSSCLDRDLVAGRVNSLDEIQTFVQQRIPACAFGDTRACKYKMSIKKGKWLTPPTVNLRFCVCMFYVVSTIDKGVANFSIAAKHGSIEWANRESCECLGPRQG